MTASTTPLGDFLRDRRARLDPAAFGFTVSRRRTPGLRREEVAQRAHVSATWYTWLEQGRGGAPSAQVLDRIAGALMLSADEREHIHLLALGRPPEAHRPAPTRVSERLVRVLDSLPESPAFVKNASWDVLAWNRAAAAVLYDYGTLAPDERNIVRLVFRSERVRAANPDWMAVARFVVAAFRTDAARAGMPERAKSIVDDLRRSSPEFEALWLENDVRSHGEGTKVIEHVHAGPIALEYSAFAVDAQPELSMVVYTPASARDAEKVRRLVGASR